VNVENAIAFGVGGVGGVDGVDRKNAYRTYFSAHSLKFSQLLLDYNF